MIDKLDAYIYRAYCGTPLSREFAHVLMFAGGVGIFAHIPYIKFLLSLYRTRQVKVQKIDLIWEYQSAQQLYSVRGYMDKLLSMDDSTKMLDFSLYESTPHDSGRVPQVIDTRLRITPGHVNVADVLAKELRLAQLSGSKSKLLVLGMRARSANVFLGSSESLTSVVSAEPGLRDSVREEIVGAGRRDKNLLTGVRLSELEFQPQEVGGLWRSRRREGQPAGLA